MLLRKSKIKEVFSVILLQIYQTEYDGLTRKVDFTKKKL